MEFKDVKDVDSLLKKAIDVTLPTDQPFKETSSKALGGALDYISRLKETAQEMVDSEDLVKRQNLFNDLVKYLTLIKDQILLFGEAKATGEISSEPGPYERAEAPRYLEEMSETKTGIIKDYGRECYKEALSVGETSPDSTKGAITKESC
ncbi:MAG TPA: hypothetical protein P5136_06360 [Methanofastidiosum sp.]|nr:hypothetical protein [Methanofastidiosum sp.]